MPAKSQAMLTLSGALELCALRIVAQASCVRREVLYTCVDAKSFVPSLSKHPALPQLSERRRPITAWTVLSLVIV